MGEPENPVNMRPDAVTRWSRVNFGEAIQGVQTPLSWAVWERGMEIATRRGMRTLGILGADETTMPADPARRMCGVFYGRSAGNVNFFRMVGARIPGSSPDVLEEKVFGEVSGAPLAGRPGGVARSAAIAVKFPVGALRAPGGLRALLAEQRVWWRRSVIEAPPTDLDGGQRLVREGADRFLAACVGHSVVSMIGPQLLEALTELAGRTLGDPALGMDLASGYGGMEETELIADLWAAAQGRLDLAEIQRRHGYHGPDEGKLETRSWREDPAPVRAVLAGYRRRDLADPRARERERTARRQELATRVLAALPPWKRPGARLVMSLAGNFITAREVGKAAFLHALDGARCGARVTGRALVERGLLDDPEDVFFLTLDEVTGPPDGDLRERAGQRKADHHRYLGLELPPAWYGTPEPVVAAPADTPRPATLRGIGVVGSKVTGRARVVHDPATVEFEDGDILVCATTDPSWTPLFMLADALVIDTGGQLSHGAIVARELGVCCVINTVTGTRDIPDGATVTVDGATGLVEVREDHRTPGR
jgi:pyruvate,water dikinase